jgi:hypothetical protein
MNCGTHFLRLVFVALVVSTALCACSSTSPDPAGGSGIGGYGILAALPPDAGADGAADGASANDGAAANDTGIPEGGGAVQDVQSD